MAEHAFAEESQVQEAALRAPEPPPPPPGGGYLGSVRFFKHLILTVLALSILIPTVLSIVFGVSLRRTKVELRDLRQIASQLQQAASQEDEPVRDEEDPGPENLRLTVPRRTRSLCRRCPPIRPCTRTCTHRRWSAAVWTRRKSSISPLTTVPPR